MKSNPTTYSTVIKSTTETALQRSIIINERSIIDGEEVTWLDIELPVDKKRKARGHCIDLIGKTSKGYIICELKFGKDSGTDDPIDAETEVQRYIRDIQYNFPDLDEDDNIHHTNGKHFFWKDVAQNCRPIIAANGEYWSYWIKHRGMDIPKETACYSLNVDVQYFKQLKRDKEEYEPRIKDIVWTKL